MTTIKKWIQFAAVICRLIAGIVFMFSGLVKAIDPLGSQYKFVDYFYAFGMPQLEGLALPLAILLIVLEFAIGACLVMQIQRYAAHWGALLFMMVFTPLTLWLALTNPVSDCGCFGDAWVMSNWETFYKNVVITVVVVIAFAFRKQMIKWISIKTQWIITGVAAILIILFSGYNLTHLPVIDFRPYKVGTYIPDQMVIPEGAPADEYEQYFTLKDTLSGQVISIESNAYMNDSTYWRQGTIWQFVSSTEPKLIKKGYTPPIHDFSIVSLTGEDLTHEILHDTGSTFLVIAYDLNQTNIQPWNHLNKLHHKAVEQGHRFICLTASTHDIIARFKEQHQPAFEFYHTDPITLKTIVRSNPGLVVLYRGTIIGKWHHRQLPTYEGIETNANHQTKD
ncbi:MAG: DoxX family protein [Marinilabiliaceae bacterium]|nr:DoxX family protein [Marinilabiliaceae bacterium]